MEASTHGQQPDIKKSLPLTAAKKKKPKNLISDLVKIYRF